MVTIPLVIGLGLDVFMGATREIHLAVPSTILQLFLVVGLPLAVGMYVRFRHVERAMRLEKIITKVAVLLLLTLIIGAVMKERARLGEYFGILGLPIIILSLSTTLFGLLSALVFRLSMRQSVTIGIEVGKEFSDDSGSAKSSGELGFLGKGVLVKEFEDALFQMEPNEIRGPVETAFGFHIIKLSEIKPAQVAPVEEVEDSIEEMLKRQKITSRVGEIAEEFSNIVYEQSDSLLPAADRFNLTVKQSDDWINKKSREPVEIANEKLMQALFSEDVIKEGRNTDAIEVMPDTFVSARVLEHKPATAQSLEVVRDRIVEKLKLQLAAEKTAEEWSDKLATTDH